MKYNNILKRFERIESDGTTTKFILGTEPRFIDSILGSNSRNLEEQLLLGNNYSISTSFNENQTKYIVTKTFDADTIKGDYFKIVSEYTLYNTNLLLYILLDERDGNYQVKTANTKENGASYSNDEDKAIILSDNGLYTLSNLNIENNVEFEIANEKLYYCTIENNSGELIRTKTINGKINNNTFTTNITIIG